MRCGPNRPAEFYTPFCRKLFPLELTFSSRRLANTQDPLLRRGILSLLSLSLSLCLIFSFLLFSYLLFSCSALWSACRLALCALGVPRRPGIVELLLVLIAASTVWVHPKSQFAVGGVTVAGEGNTISQRENAHESHQSPFCKLHGGENHDFRNQCRRKKLLIDLSRFRA